MPFNVIPISLGWGVSRWATQTLGSRSIRTFARKVWMFGRNTNPFVWGALYASGTVVGYHTTDLFFSGSGRYLKHYIRLNRI